MVELAPGARLELSPPTGAFALPEVPGAELAAAYHSYYDSERILVDDARLKAARLALVAACAQVLHNGLAVLGVDAPQKM